MPARDKLGKNEIMPASDILGISHHLSRPMDEGDLEDGE